MPNLVPTVVAPPAGRSRLAQPDSSAGTDGNGAGRKPAKQPRRKKADYTVEEIPVGQIVPSRFQARKIFDAGEIAALTTSILKNDLADPIRVRPLAASDRPADNPDARYELVFGERRWRATIALGRKTITAHVRKIDDRTSFSLGAAENMHVSLSPIEEAQQYQRGMRQFDLNQNEVAEECCVPKTRVSRLLKLLKLPEEVQTQVAAGLIAPATAMVILGVEGKEARIRVAEKVVARGLTVGGTEALILQMQANREISPSRKALPRGKKQTVQSLMPALKAIREAKQQTAALLELPGKELPSLCQAERAAAQQIIDALDSWGEDVGMLKDELKELLAPKKK